jgi:hypothetical protein
VPGLRSGHAATARHLDQQIGAAVEPQRSHMAIALVVDRFSSEVSVQAVADSAVHVPDIKTDVNIGIVMK